MDEVDKLIEENTSAQEDCEFCNESRLKVGEKTDYGSVIIYKIGTEKNGWFATLSPKTGSDPEKDFTIQLMPFAHLTHFAQIADSAENYGVAFSKLSKAMAKIMAEEKELKATADSKEYGIAIGNYGKCTTWKEKKEHLHIKIFPFRGNIGQPYTVDSSFTKKEIRKDPETHEKFVKMTPVSKKRIDKERFEYLSKTLIEWLK